MDSVVYPVFVTDPLAKSKDDGSPNFIAHPQAAAVFLQGFTVMCIENGNQESNARHYLHE